MHRRNLLRRAGLGLLGVTGLYGYATRLEPHWLAVNRYDLPLAKLPASLHHKTIVHLSDLHVGSTDLDYLRRSMRRVRDLRPDLLLLTGDFIDRASNRFERDLEIVLAELPSPPLGAFACLGNHDHGLNWRQEEVAQKVCTVAEDRGIRVLRDKQTDVLGLPIFGMNDFWTPGFQWERIMISAMRDKPGLCLCHNPDVADLSVWDDFRGVILSGHTHGGQCKPPFLPPPLLPVKNRRYTSGFFDIDEDRTMFINRGVGHTLKARFNCRPEVVVFRLVEATSV